MFKLKPKYKQTIRDSSVSHTPIYMYITLYLFIFPICLCQRSRSLFLYMDRSLYQYMDRPGTCIIILDKKYNIANSSCHFGSYGSIWTGPSPKKILYGPRHMTLSAMNYVNKQSETVPFSRSNIHVYRHVTVQWGFAS